MKTYEALKLDVIRFEVQDVVTASVPDTNCICERVEDDAYASAYHWQHFANNVVCTADVHNHTCNDKCHD